MKKYTLVLGNNGRSQLTPKLLRKNKVICTINFINILIFCNFEGISKFKQGHHYIVIVLKTLLQLPIG